MTCYRREAGAIVVSIRLTPKADRDAVVGIGVLSDGREVLQARVRAVPEDGAANVALVALMAKALRLAKSSIAIAAGATQRLKQIRIAGDPADLAKRIETLAAGSWRAQP